MSVLKNLLPCCLGALLVLICCGKSSSFLSVSYQTINNVNLAET